MEKINEDFLIKLDTNSILSNIGEMIIAKLYLPIIGCNALSLYFLYTYKIHLNEKENELSDLLMSLKFNLDDFNNARKILEAVGLIKSYVKNNVLLEIVYSPKSPINFFDDVLLKGLLVRSIGSNKVEQIKEEFSNKIDRTNFKEITSRFDEVFDVDVDSNDFDYNPENNEFLLQVKTKDSPMNFDYDYFKKIIQEKYKLKDDFFTKDELKYFAKLANLYGLSEILMADIVMNCIDFYSKDKKIDLDLLKSKCYDSIVFANIKKQKTKKYKISSSTDLAKKIDYMEKLDPYNYLKIKQNNVNPIHSDLKILEKLKLDLGLTNGVINAIVDYTLEKNKGLLNLNFMEKIGATLLRNDINSAYDSIMFLQKLNSENSKNYTTNIDKTRSNKNINQGNKKDTDNDDNKIYTTEEILKALNDEE